MIAEHLYEMLFWILLIANIAYMLAGGFKYDNKK